MAETNHWSRVALLPRLRGVVLVALIAAWLLSVATTVSVAGTVELRGAALATFVVLLLWWAWTYRSDRLPRVSLPVEVAATSLALITIPDPLQAFGVAVLAVKFRSLYPGWARSSLFTGGVVAITVAASAFGLVPRDGRSLLDGALLVVAIPTVMVITQIVAIAIAQRDIRIERERELAATAVAMVGTTDRSQIADLAASAAIRMIPTAPGASAQLAPAGYGEPQPDDGLAFEVPGRKAKAAFLVVRVSGGVPNGARHALTALAQTVGAGLSNAETFDRLRSSAEYDHLTGLRNRAGFMNRLESAVAGAEVREHSPCEPGRVWLIMINIDSFRQVNSTWGHGAGDKVLVAVADRIARCVNEADVVARLGGDEFAVLVTTTVGSDRAEQVADRIHSALRLPIDLQPGVVVRTSGRLGIGHWESGLSGDDILNEAIEAMRSVKQDAMVTLNGVESPMAGVR